MTSRHSRSSQTWQTACVFVAMPLCGCAHPRRSTADVVRLAPVAAVAAVAVCCRLLWPLWIDSPRQRCTEVYLVVAAKLLELGGSPGTIERPARRAPPCT